MMKMSNAVEPSTAKFKHDGFKVGKGIPSKGGKTTNFEIPEWMFEKEMEIFLKEGSLL